LGGVLREGGGGFLPFFLVGGRMRLKEGLPSQSKKKIGGVEV